MSEGTRIVAAAPGYDLVDAITEEDGSIAEFSLTPIVAWTILSNEPHQYAWPIALGYSEPQMYSIVRAPSGKFYNLEGNEFASEQDVLEELRRLAEKS